MHDIDLNSDINKLRIDLLSSFFLFTRVFYEARTNREFIVSNPVSNESHFHTIAREFVNVFRGDVNRLMINVSPGWGKSLMCQHFVAWAFAHHPDSRFLYISHSFELAASHTHSIKKIMEMPIYKLLFDVNLRRDQSAKDFFETMNGGAIAAFGAKGSITGRDAGLPGLSRFTGGLIIDDIHKPDEVHSDLIREKVHKNYFETIQTRLRSENVPVIFIGHRLHEGDLPSHLLSGADGKQWKHVSIKARSDSGHSRYPEVISLQTLNEMERLQPYVFSSQYQQEPIPAGGALFKPDWFVLHDEEPEILTTFITGDTAETEKTYNDPTAFGFWGLYRIKHDALNIDMYGLHLLNCIEEWVEPKDLEELFNDFYFGCMTHSVKPSLVAIEKKSTGTTLLSLLKQKQGLSVVDIPRDRSSGNKTARFLTMQPYIADRKISLPSYGRHTQKYIKHMVKITANETHMHDDIADMTFDAIDIALIRRMMINQVANKDDKIKIAKNVMSKAVRLRKLKNARYHQK